MQWAKVPVADGLNGGCQKIRRWVHEIFQAGVAGSIAQGVAALDEIFERRATDSGRPLR
ncbi:hypothetical protein [Pseudomonas kairouanensis]|uniref:hypothetical protein n=1 Tax=Pseudomonas kairouanensis TaxID=2293832 RepID=UPI00142F10C3|nr:hypothetical protein [Pseudomonas kairouanensis]